MRNEEFEPVLKVSRNHQILSTKEFLTTSFIIHPSSFLPLVAECATEHAAAFDIAFHSFQSLGLVGNFLMSSIIMLIFTLVPSWTLQK